MSHKEVDPGEPRHETSLNPNVCIICIIRTKNIPSFKHDQDPGLYNLLNVTMSEERIHIKWISYQLNEWPDKEGKSKKKKKLVLTDELEINSQIHNAWLKDTS